tara:strand:- start:11945 stop:12724 length:780 start_codon:yes stop_codon:yes gene_type:complete
MIEYIEYIPQVKESILPLLTAVGGLAQIGMGIDWGGKKADAARNAQKAFDDQKDIYKGLDTSNTFAGTKNRFQNLGNAYKGVENSFEDMTVNTQQADFMAEQSQQSAANIMQNLKGAAGGSGVAGLAQAMAQQQTQQMGQASASIGMQEAKNQQLAAGAQSKIDMMTAQQDNQNSAMKAKGFADVDKLIGQGAFRAQSAEASKQATLLGMDANTLAAANQEVAAGKAMVAGGVGGLLGGLAGGFGADGKYDLKNLTKVK